MLAEQQTRLLQMASKALDVYEGTLDSTDAHLAAATATKILEGTGVMDKRGLQGTIDDAVNRQILRSTPVLREFEQGPEGFRRRKPRRKPVKAAS